MKIGGYEVEGLLGRGGMGVVHRARAGDGRAVALKVLEAGAGLEAVERFERERRLLAELSATEGFVPLLDAGTDGGRPWLVMPLLANGTLRARFDRGLLPVRDALLVVRELARAAGRAHARGVVHRDLKPENVLFSDDGRPLIADLGLAKHFTRTTLDTVPPESLTEAGTALGSVGYLAPEQLDSAKDVGPAADVFALGAILHEALAGARAFPGKSLLAHAMAVKQGPPPPASSRRVGIPFALDALVARALALDPSERPADGLHLARELDVFLERDAPPRRGLLLVAGVAAALALGGGAWAAFAPRAAAPPLTPPAPAAKPPAPRPSPPPAPSTERARRAAEAEEYRRRAVECQGRKDRDGAIANFMKALELVPDDPRLIASHAALRLEHGETEAALAEATRATDLAPGLVDGWLVRASAFATREAWPDAVACLARAVALAPDRMEYRTALAEARLTSGDAPGALADFEIAVADGPKVKRALAGRAAARRKLGDLLGCEADLSEILRLYPDTAAAFVNRGKVRAEQGKHAEAAADYTRAVELVVPLDVELLHCRAVELAMSGDRAGARRDFERLLEAAPDRREQWEGALKALEAGR